ncbi:hypothetical protein BCR35DRAFT_265810, partial [Leucosporidium creatinivorum]
VIVYCDNEAVCGAWLRGRSREKGVNSELQKLLPELWSWELDLDVRRVTSADNVADAASRGANPEMGRQGFSFIALPPPPHLDSYLVA